MMTNLRKLITSPVRRLIGFEQILTRAERIETSTSSMQSELESFKRHLITRKTNDCADDFLKKTLITEVLHCLGIILRGIKKTDRLIKAAIIGEGGIVAPLSEILADCGFDTSSLIFYGMVPSVYYKTAPLESLDTKKYDLIFGKRPNNKMNFDGVTFFFDIEAFVDSMYFSLKKMNSFPTCLNPRKLTFIALALYFSPPSGSVIEAGAYQCGTTIFCANLQRKLGFFRQIYAIDSFLGMPAATEKDKSDEFYYDTGMFLDNPIEAVQKRITDEGVSSDIRLEQGLIQDVIKGICDKNVISFAFLDSDQYTGTISALNAVKKKLLPYGLIIIDDTAVKGVKEAIQEFCSENPTWIYSRYLTYDFDLLCSPDFTLKSDAVHQ